MNIRRVSLPLLLALAVLASPARGGDILVLECEGTFPTYDEGFGAAFPESKGTTVRLVEIDVEAGTASMLTLFGQRVAAMRKAKDEKYFSFVFKHDTKYKGRLVSEEQVSINRYTGEILSIYVVEPRVEGSLGYSAFSGSCKRATRKF